MWLNGKSFCSYDDMSWIALAKCEHHLHTFRIIHDQICKNCRESSHRATLDNQGLTLIVLWCCFGNCNCAWMIGDPNLRLLKLEFDAVYFFEVICGDLKTHGCLDQGSTGLLWNFFPGDVSSGLPTSTALITWPVWSSARLLTPEHETRIRVGRALVVARVTNSREIKWALLQISFVKGRMLSFRSWRLLRIKPAFYSQAAEIPESLLALRFGRGCLHLKFQKSFFGIHWLSRLFFSHHGHLRRG